MQQAATTTVDERHTSSYRWVILAMIAVSGFIGAGFQTTALPVLFAEIAQSLNLDLVQIGYVYGFGSLMGIGTALIAGPIVDYIGTRRSVSGILILLGFIGAMRALAVNFWTLMGFMLLFGALQSVLPICLVKMNTQWFPPHRRGMANGLMSVGFATGLLSGSTFAATVLSPVLGGWRMVLITIGVISVGIGILWIFIHPPNKTRPTGTLNVMTVFEKLPVVMSLPSLWILAFIGFGVGGFMRGMVGYVPSYLKAIGWAGGRADLALSTFFLASLIGVMPVSMLSDHLRSRRFTIMGATLLMTTGTILMFFAGDNPYLVYPAMAIAGVAFDGFMSTHNAAISEAKGLDPSVIGTAVGFGMMVRIAGTAFGPSVGNKLSDINLAYPFLLWAALGLMAFFLTILFREEKIKAPEA